MRGSGATGQQGELAAYNIDNLAPDITGLLDHLAIPQATVIGHDFGGHLAWALARDHADRFNATASLNTPHTPHGKTDLITALRHLRGEANYMVVFQTPGAGEAILESEIGETFRGTFRRPALSLDACKADAHLSELPVTVYGREAALLAGPFEDDDVTAVYIEAFEKTGFTGGIN